MQRFEDQGAGGLADRSRRPLTSPTKTPEHVAEAILLLRKRHPLWRAKKLLWVLEQRHPEVDWPSRSTVCDLLKRNEMVPDKRRRKFPGHPGRPTTPMNAPNEIWCADFKGEFKTKDGIYCYPLTMTDGFSRFLLGCKALTSTAHEGAKLVFKRAFKSSVYPSSSEPTMEHPSLRARSAG